MQPRIRAAILGSGNIGTDLMFKLSKRGKRLEIGLLAGIDPASEGLARAGQLGIPASSRGIEAVLEDASLEIVFDATTAQAHLAHAPRLRAAGRMAVDLTPAAVGPYVVPAIDIDLKTMDEPNINMVTCGGQATVPIVWAVGQETPVEYAEVVATIASRSAGPGTRANIDEFTVTTAKALERVGGARRAKAIIILNPAEPPIINRDAVYIRTAAEIEPERQGRIIASIDKMVRTIQSYVPGYALRYPPVFGDRQVTVMLEVRGAGDFLPEYAGNLDIMTSAAMAAGEAVARRKSGSGTEGD